eukprot:scaffold13160_cov106-Isochrysis_galbana.AAC.7
MNMNHEHDIIEYDRLIAPTQATGAQRTGMAHTARQTHKQIDTMYTDTGCICTCEHEKRTEASKSYATCAYAHARSRSSSLRGRHAPEVAANSPQHAAAAAGANFSLEGLGLCAGLLWGRRPAANGAPSGPDDGQE